MITRDTIVIGTAPRISPATFEAVLRAAGSPAAGEAQACYEAIAGQGVDPYFALAVFQRESRYGTDPASIVVKFKTCNPGNCRSSTIGTMPLINTDRGVFVKYPDWPTGFRDLAHRLVDKNYVYAQEGRVTIAQIIERWAPKGDFNNDPEKYINAVVSSMNKWIGEGSTTMQDPTTQVHLIPGHAGRGRDGVRPKLIVCHVQEGANDLYQEFLNRPPGAQADCTIWSKQDGTLVRLLNDTDTPWTNGDVVDPDMSNSIIAGMVLAGVGNTNAYSYTIEHQGFASKGFSDAQIEATAKICAYWCFINGWEPTRDRIVGHYQVGAHKNCPGPLFPFDRVVARAKVIVGGAAVTPVYDPIAVYVAANGGEAVFGKRTSPGLYGTNGSIEADYEWAHLFLNKATGLVEAQMKDRVNPKGFDIGPGVYSVLQAENMTALTNENYYVPDGNKPGLTKCSFTYAARDKVTYKVEAIQDQSPDGKPLPTWTRQVWQFIKEID